MKKLAVFDWNGTLIDDLPANVAASNACLEALGAAPVTTERYLDTFDFPVLHFYVRNGVSADHYLKNLQEAGESFMLMYHAEAKKCGLRRGATQLMDWLIDQGYELIVLSNFVRHALEAQIAEHHVTQYFTYVSANENFNETEHSKTNKLERLEAYLAQNHIDRDHSFIVGDSLEEIEVSKHLGLTGFSIAGGSLGRHRLEAARPDYLIDDLAEIREILQKRSS